MFFIQIMFHQGDAIRQMETFQRDKTFSSSERNRKENVKNIRDLEICEVVETKVVEGDDGWTLEVEV